MIKNNSTYTKGSSTFQETINAKIRSLSDRELIAMVNSPTADYLPEALSIANDEINIRGGMDVLMPQVQKLILNEIEEDKEEKRRIKEEKISDAKTGIKFWIIFIFVILVISSFVDWGEGNKKIISTLLRVPIVLIIIYWIRISFNRKKDGEQIGIISNIVSSKDKNICTMHNDKKAIGICAVCKKSYCENCLTEIDGYNCCPNEACKNYFIEIKKTAYLQTLNDYATNTADEIFAILLGSSKSLNDFMNYGLFIEASYLAIYNARDLIKTSELMEEEKLILITNIIKQMAENIKKMISAKDDYTMNYMETLKNRIIYYNQHPWKDGVESFDEDELFNAFSENLTPYISGEITNEIYDKLATLYALTSGLPISLIREKIVQMENLRSYAGVQREVDR